MLKEKHYISKDFVQWTSYEEVPCAIDIKAYDDINTKTSAIIGWKVIIDKNMICGDTVLELVEFLTSIEAKGNYIIFCDDLDYLNAFISNYINIDKSFDVGGKGLASINFGSVELRDVRYIGTDKWQGFSTAKTKVEMLYDFACYYWENIVTKKKIEGKVPLTLQQVVSQKMKAKMTQEDKDLIQELFPKTKEGYKLAVQKLYIGGYCDKALDADVAETCGHVDFKTSYVARMLTDYYPMTSFKKANKNNLYELLKTKCCIIKVTYKNFKLKSCSFLAKKRALNIKNGKYDAVQKIIYADSVTFLLNELDFELVSMCYTFSDMIIEDIHIAERGQLPEYVRKVAEDCYAAKETRTGIDKIWAKLCTEIIYGATVKSLYNIDDQAWSDLRTKQFLSPYWGIWTTSHARYALISHIILLGSDFLYSDTDSIYYKNPLLHVQLIEKHNQDRRVKNELYCLKNGLDYSIFSELGTFTYEDGATKDHFTITRFKSLGPKRYIYDGECGLTVKVAGYKKQYSKDDKLVSAWEKNFDRNNIFKYFEDYTKISDIMKNRVYSDEAITIKYHDREYPAHGYVYTFYIKTNTSTKEVFESVAEAEAKIVTKATKLGKEMR